MVWSLTNYVSSRAERPAFDMTSIGQDLEAKGDLKGAFEQYQKAVKISPRFPYGLALLGNAYHKLGNDDKALEQYKKALKISPRHFWVHYLVGVLYREQSRYVEAIAEFKELITMKDNWYHSNRFWGYIQYQNVAYGELGYCYAKIGDRQNTIASYEKYLTLNPSAPDAREVSQYLQRLKDGQ